MKTITHPNVNNGKSTTNDIHTVLKADINKFFDILGEQPIHVSVFETLGAIRKFAKTKEGADFTMLAKAYAYGVIQGKRAVRRKRMAYLTAQEVGAAHAK